MLQYVCGGEACEYVGQGEGCTFVRGKAAVGVCGLYRDAAAEFGTKMARNSWSAEDLVRVAGFVGAKVGFVMPDGTCIYLETEENEEQC